MSITLNITPPVTDAVIDETIATLERLRGGCAGGCHPDPDRGEPQTVAAPESTAPATEPEPQTTAPAAETPETDKTGLPWDARIHSGNKTLKADGTWKAKRGVDAELVKQVEAELRGTATTEAPAGVQTESKSESTPPPGAAEAMNSTAPVPPAPATETRYKHGDQLFTREQLVGWTDDQVATLEQVRVPAEPAATAPPAPQTTAAPATAMTFADVAKRAHEEGLDMDGVINPKVAEVAAGLGKPQVSAFALLAAPDNADVLAGLVTALWPQG